MALTRTNGWARPTDSGNVSITGRTLTHYTIGLTGVHTGYAVADSDFEKLVRAISQVGSIELLGTPTSDAFRVAISGAAPAATTGSASLQGYCNTAINGSGVSGATVTAFTY
jgi:hypothetical protein